MKKLFCDKCDELIDEELYNYRFEICFKIKEDKKARLIGEMCPKCREEFNILINKFFNNKTKKG